MLKKLCIALSIVIVIICLNKSVYATIRGDADRDTSITAFDAYQVLSKSLLDLFDENILQMLDMDCDAAVTAFDAYSVLKKSIADDINDFETPEQYGAVGDGVNDDTDAFERCMQSDAENIVLTGDYLITRNLTSNKKKHFYNGKILCQSTTYRVLTFSNQVSFEDTIFVCDRDLTGTAAHGETFQHTSSTYFVEIWGNYASFDGCVFDNAITAIRGRISTGATTIPEQVDVNHCRFTECKIPIQGYFKYTNVNNSSFKNEGDLYSGEHCVYIEAYQSEELNVKGCKVETLNTESGAAFQIYGKAKDNTTTTPTIDIENCEINANGIVSVDCANVIVKKTDFDAQHAQRYVYTVEEGTLLIEDSYVNHSYFISTAGYNNGLRPIAKDCTFRIKKEITNGRSYFPFSSTNCTFVNWGGTNIYENTTITNCTFTRDTSNVVGKYYIGAPETTSIYINNSAFKSGDNVSYNSPGYIELNNCHYINNIGTNVTNYQENNTIHEDIVD
jgi:hypothetical protein